MSFSHILFETIEDGIALVTINRPEKRNALNRAVIGDLEQVVNRVADDPGVRAMILTGAGDKAFVAGADVSEIEAAQPAEAERISASGQRVFRDLELLRKPTVAAIRGFALGGGLELAMCCHIRVAGPDARFGQPEVKLGLTPGYGGTQRLPRLIGRGRALELLMTGDTIDAAEAYRYGLVNYVTPQHELLPFCRQWLRKVLRNSPVAIGLTLEAVSLGADQALDTGLRTESIAFGLSAASEDRREGTRAFLEKRQATFAGK